MSLGLSELIMESTIVVVGDDVVHVVVYVYVRERRRER